LNKITATYNINGDSGAGGAGGHHLGEQNREFRTQVIFEKWAKIWNGKQLYQNLRVLNINNIKVDFLTEFIEKVSSELSDFQKVVIARKTYLLENKDDIIKAVEMGYHYPMIANFITEQLLKTDIPKVYTIKNEEGEEVEVKTIMPVAHVREFYEKEMGK